MYTSTHHVSEHDLAKARNQMVGNVLQRIKGHPLASKMKKPNLAKKIMNYYPVSPSQRVDPAGFIVQIESDNAQSIPIHIYPSGSPKLKRESRLNNWITTKNIEITEHDTVNSVFRKVIQALLEAYNFLRRTMDNRKARKRNKFLRRLQRGQYHPHDRPESTPHRAEQWCLRPGAAFSN